MCHSWIETQPELYLSKQQSALWIMSCFNLSATSCVGHMLTREISGVSSRVQAYLTYPLQIDVHWLLFTNKPNDDIPR